MEILEKENRKR